MEDKDIQVQEKRNAEVEAETTTGGPMFVPHADIYEDKDSMTVVVDMPGVDKDAVNIKLENDRLSLYGKVDKPGFESKPVYSEYRIGDYSRSFIIPDTIDRSKIDANMNNGVLYLRLPKAEHTKPRQIEVKLG